MPWWSWIIVGAVLLGAETVVSTEFYLVFLGAAALLVGLLELSGIEAPHWMQWLVFGALSVLSIIGFRQRVWARVNARTGKANTVLVGETAVIKEALNPGAVGAGELRGTHWSVQNVGETRLEAGARVVVVAVQGLVLHVSGKAQQDSV